MNYLNSNEIGVFAKLTNSYCLIADKNCKNYPLLESELSEIPIIETTICDTNIIGRMTAGNKNGLLVPSAITDKEIKQLRDYLPEEIEIKKIDDKLSALGNVICCNDYIAIIHPDMDLETEETIKDTLNVEVYRTTISSNVLVGSYCVVSNQGGIVHPMVGGIELEELSNIFQIPIAAGTINRGSDILASGCLVNDTNGFVGGETTTSELMIFDGIFKLNSNAFRRNDSEN
jgi:translation initiation factor 6